MSETYKFLFETDFDEETGFADDPGFAADTELAESARGAHAEAEPPPSYSQEELDAARDEGYRAGHAEGLEAGRADVAAAAETAKADALDKLGERLEALRAEIQGSGEQRSRESLDVALTLVSKLFPALTRRYGREEIEDLIIDSLERLREEPRVVVRVADSQLDALRERVDELAAKSGFDGRIVLLADADLSEGDVRADWADGGAERDTGRIWREIESAADRALGSDDRADEGGPAAAIDGRTETAGTADAAAATNSGHEATVGAATSEADDRRGNEQATAEAPARRSA